MLKVGHNRGTKRDKRRQSMGKTNQKIPEPVKIYSAPDAINGEMRLSR